MTADATNLPPSKCTHATPPHQNTTIHLIFIEGRVIKNCLRRTIYLPHKKRISVYSGALVAGNINVHFEGFLPARYLTQFKSVFPLKVYVYFFQEVLSYGMLLLIILNIFARWQLAEVLTIMQAKMERKNYHIFPTQKDSLNTCIM